MWRWKGWGEGGQAGTLLSFYLSRWGLHIDAGRCRIPQRVTLNGQPGALMVVVARGREDQQVTHYHREYHRKVETGRGIDRGVGTGNQDQRERGRQINVDDSRFFGQVETWVDKGVGR